MKFTFSKAVQIFQAFDDLLAMYPQGHPVFSAYAKRFCKVYLAPEVEFYNSLSTEERVEALKAEVDIPVGKISAQHLPDLPNDYIEILSPVVEGEIQKRKSMLQTTLNGADHG